MALRVDTAFDFHADTPSGKDPDSYSPTLREYHQLLWSKPLPSGRPFTLIASERSYLVHQSGAEEYSLSSDTITTRLRGRASKTVRQIPPETLPRYAGYTIGSSIIFPSNRVAGAATINGARGLHPRIVDRFDLTLECIRRHYIGDSNPLESVLRRHQGFFNLFGSFEAYVDFFLLQDLLTNASLDVKFFHPFNDFTTPAVPQTVDAYFAYLTASRTFITERNSRIDDYCATFTGTDPCSS
ncbi:DUF6994 family protein (plasmid) [Coraliomargarita sp. W4R53]